ncbi:PAS domain S-box protein [Methylomonas albis]|uniref:PAS domain S-box protein n=1 Tax=Methylomonas albis TaxID=1854563 RepID=A0ABR9D064_9GAMM|nr:PAS domain S-box protein [Methylomonas albis]MBD9356519.1 PAS domain S-box protein [Methylomonas albis]
MSDLLQAASAPLLLAVLDAQDVCVMATDSQGIIQAFNPAAERLLGYNRTEVVGILTPLFFFDATDLAEKDIALHERTTAESLQALSLICGEHCEWTYNGKINSRIPVALSVFSLAESQGLEAGYLLAASPMKKPPNSPEASEQFIHAVVSALPIQFCVLDAAGTILAGNRPWAEIEAAKSVGPQTLPIGQNYLSLLEGGLARHFGAEGFIQGVRSVLNGTQTAFAMEYSYASRTGRRWFEGKVVPFSDQAMGKAIVMHENITEHKKLEHRFRQAIESAPSAIVMVNELGTIVMINVQTEKSFGYSRDELIGQAVEVLVPERFRGPHIGFRQAYLAAPVSRPMGEGRELFGLRKDGSEFPVEIGLGLIDDEDGIIVLSSIIDITERRNASDKLKQALNEKEVLLKEVYHRVKNNLQVVSSLINLQAGNVKNETTGDLLKQSADRIKAMALLHEKLYHSKDLAKIDFKDYIRSLVDHLLFGYGTHSSKIAVDLRVDEVYLNVDTAIPCGLIINELLSNALKHAFPGDSCGKVDISFTHSQGELMLVIADNGIGLPDQLEINHSTSLGLQLVHTLTNQLMGEMTVERSHGAAFTLRFAEIL